MAAHSEAPSFEVIKAASLFGGAKGGMLIPQSKSTAESLPTQDEFHKELDVIKTKVKSVPRAHRFLSNPIFTC